MDELENESLSLNSDEKRKKKEQQAYRKARHLSRSADLGDEVDEGNTIFIDNLPNDEFGMRKMIDEANRLVIELEQRFFEEEDSDREQRLKTITNVTKHEEELQQFRNFCTIKHFWCIPISIDIRKLDWDIVIDSQLKYAGRHFDVVTCDPPWQLSSANPTRGVAINYDTLTDAEILRIPFDKL